MDRNWASGTEAIMLLIYVSGQYVSKNFCSFLKICINAARLLINYLF